MATPLQANQTENTQVVKKKNRKHKHKTMKWDRERKAERVSIASSTLIISSSHSLPTHSLPTHTKIPQIDRTVNVMREKELIPNTSELNDITNSGYNYVKANKDEFVKEGTDPKIPQIDGTVNVMREQELFLDTSKLDDITDSEWDFERANKDTVVNKDTETEKKEQEDNGTVNSTRDEQNFFLDISELDDMTDSVCDLVRENKKELIKTETEPPSIIPRTKREK